MLHRHLDTKIQKNFQWKPDIQGRRSPLLIPLFSLFMAFLPSHANALPSFARQTGLTCNACHAGFPELTPMGRQFKLGGYTMPGGQSKLPPLAFMVQPTFTHTNEPQPGGAAPSFGNNDNFTFQEIGLFYAGKIAGNLGAFIQGTYSGVDKAWALDNVDIRYADTAQLAGKNLTYGFTVNNNPTAQDLWNSTPVWGFPFSESDLAPAPAAATLIDGSLGQQVVGGGVYGFWNDLIYGEVTLYGALSAGTQRALGADPEGENRIKGVAPYWRFVVEHPVGPGTLSVGTSGLYAKTYPDGMRTFGNDRFVDVAGDLQYQVFMDRHTVTAQASLIHEWQKMSASNALGLTARTSNELTTFRTKATYFYRSTYGVNIGYARTSGRSDSAIYAPAVIEGSRTAEPDSTNWVFQLDYIPFNDGGPSLWPWLNVRFSTQYIVYTKFNGAKTNYDGFGRNASDNNTLFLLAWLAF